MRGARSLSAWPPRLVALAACAAEPALAMCTRQAVPSEDNAARVVAMRQACEGPRTRWRRVTPSRLVMQPRVDGPFRRAIGPGLGSGLRLAWSGQGHGGRGRLRTDRAPVASARP